MLRPTAVTFGVRRRSQAVVNVINEKYPDREIKVANAEGLRDCRKLLMAAKAASTTVICSKAWHARAAV